jgi:glycosyltransferase involved in cell wall biosynthesis
MPRLLSIAHSYVVGMNRSILEAMARAGGGRWQVVGVTPSSYHADYRWMRADPADPNSSYDLESVPIWFSKSPHLFVYGGRVRELVRAGFDVIHVWEEPYVLAAAQIAAWTPSSSALVFSSFQNIAKEYPPPFRQLQSFAVHRSSGVIAWGETVLEALATREPFKDRPMQVITPGVDLERFAPRPEIRASAREELGWHDPLPVVGYLGRFVEEKGLDLLLRALERVRHPWRALFLGGGALEPRLQAWAHEYPGRVRILTTVRHEDVPRYLNAMDVLVAPSQTRPNWREQFGRMIVEAFATGVAVIGSTSGEIPKTIGDAGIVVDENDLEGWAGAIETLVADEKVRTRYARKGVERARERFALETIAMKHLQFFESLVPVQTQRTG